MPARIDSLSGPLLVTWQLTRDCDLACLHCCTESAPGKRLPDELTRAEALALADDIVESAVPYVMLAGGEPLACPHFFEVAERLQRATNPAEVKPLKEELARLTIGS
jgi:MoaA/NifB/PqqE/SkfB family radical SAM enzyme